MLKLLRNLFNLTAGTILLGFVVALVGAYLEPAISPVGAVLGGIGLSIVVTAIVTTMLNYRFQEMIHSDLPPRISPPSKLDLEPFEVHSRG